MKVAPKLQQTVYSQLPHLNVSFIPKFVKAIHKHMPLMHCNSTSLDINKF